MKLHHLSASSAKLFEQCEAQWSAKYVGGGGEPSGEAANLGSAIHEALEQFLIYLLAIGRPVAMKTYEDRLYDFYKEAYWERMSSSEMFDEGQKMLVDWINRHEADYWQDRQVVSLEQRLEMPLETEYGVIPFVYIIDRLDQHENGELEVVDYKSGRWQLNGYDLRHDIQARSYATAIWKNNPDQDLYWVTFDYLRGDAVGVAFRATECSAHYAYLVRLAERIIESDGTKETVNPGCRFCLRKQKCAALAKYDVADGTIGAPVEELLAKRVELDALQKAVEQMISDIDATVKVELKESDAPELGEEGGVTVSLTSRRSRVVDSEAVVDVIGPEAALKFVKVGVSELDELMENANPNEEAQLKKAVSWKSGRSRLSYKQPKK